MKTLLAHIIVLHYPLIIFLFYVSYTAAPQSNPSAWTFLDLGFKLQTWIINKRRVLAETNTVVGTSLIAQMCIHLASVPPQITDFL